MEKVKKDLKVYSIVILAFVAFTLVRAIVSACVYGIPQPAEIPQDSTKEMVKIMTIIAFVLSFVLLLPQVYVGFKGIKIADGAICNKAPRVWAIILALLAGIATVSGLIDLFKLFTFDQLLSVLDTAVDVVLFVCYYLCLCKLARA